MALGICRGANGGMRAIKIPGTWQTGTIPFDISKYDYAQLTVSYGGTYSTFILKVDTTKTYQVGAPYESSIENAVIRRITFNATGIVLGKSIWVNNKSEVNSTITNLYGIIGKIGV